MAVKPEKIWNVFQTRSVNHTALKGEWFDMFGEEKSCCDLNMVSKEKKKRSGKISLILKGRSVSDMKKEL